MTFRNCSTGFPADSPARVRVPATLNTGERRTHMEHILGTLWWSALMFIAGAVIGVPLWKWVKTKLPWGN